MENKKNWKDKILPLALLLSVTATGTVALLTDTVSITNTVKEGGIKIEMTEPEWDKSTTHTILPNQTLAKDPTVKNVDVSDAYVFAEVTVPYVDNLTVVGEAQPLAKGELFKFTPNTGWVELTALKKEDATAKTVTHVYAYATSETALKKLEPQETSVLFNNMQMENVVANHDKTGNGHDIPVKFKAIQTEGLGTTAPAEIYALIK